MEPRRLSPVPWRALRLKVDPSNHGMKPGRKLLPRTRYLAGSHPTKPGPERERTGTQPVTGVSSECGNTPTGTLSCPPDLPSNCSSLHRYPQAEPGGLGYIESGQATHPRLVSEPEGIGLRVHARRTGCPRRQKVSPPRARRNPGDSDGNPPRDAEGFKLYSFQLQDPKEPCISIYCHYLPVSGLGNLRACCLPWMW